MNSLFFDSAARSATGLIRNGNEDGALTHPRLLAVADGMGGHAGGEVASSIALLVLARRSAIFLDHEIDQDSADDLFNSSIEDIDDALKEASDEDSDLVGLGTTLTSTFLRNNKLALLHVGDSRLYRIQGKKIEQLSTDHTVMQELLIAGTITVGDIAEHPQRSMLTQALMGAGTLSTLLHIFEVKESDRFILCSDGLSGVLEDQKIFALVQSLSPQDAVTALVDAAYVQGAPDNVTVVVADIASGQPKNEHLEFFGTATP